MIVLVLFTEIFESPPNRRQYVTGIIWIRIKEFKSHLLKMKTMENEEIHSIFVFEKAVPKSRKRRKKRLQTIGNWIQRLLVDLISRFFDWKTETGGTWEIREKPAEIPSIYGKTSTNYKHMVSICRRLEGENKNWRTYCSHSGVKVK